DIGKPRGPVEGLAGQQFDLAVVEPRLHAITVELDLMHPAGAAWHFIVQRPQRWRYEVGQRGVARALFLRTPPTRLLLAATALDGADVAAGGAGFHILRDAFVRVPDALLSLACRDLLDRAAGDDGLRHLFQNVGLLGRTRGVIGCLDQEP